MANSRAVQNTIYYHDEQNDEFSGIKRQPKFIADDYRYINNNIFFKIGRFFVYRIVMTPVAFLYMKFKFRHKIVNKQILKPYRHHGLHPHRGRCLTPYEFSELGCDCPS